MFPRRGAACLAGLTLAACGAQGVHVSWSITFESPTLAAGAVRVIATVHDGTTCAGATRYTTSVAHGAEPTVTVPMLPPGTYTLCAAAVDDTCTVFGTGETTIDLAHAPPRANVLIIATAAAPACPGTGCDHGDCVAPDGGPRDGGPPPTDLGVDAPPPVDAATDLGPPDMGCVPRTVVAPTSAACAISTSGCIAVCGDQACYDGCVAADPTPGPCGTCLQDSYDACANAHGCVSQWNVAFCCAAACSDPLSAGCCPVEWNAYNTCENGLTATCDPAQNVCFG